MKYSEEADKKMHDFMYRLEEFDNNRNHSIISFACPFLISAFDLYIVKTNLRTPSVSYPLEHPAAHSTNTGI
jgi:hypothetical protein